VLAYGPKVQDIFATQTISAFMPHWKAVAVLINTYCTNSL